VDEFIELMSLQQNAWAIPNYPADAHLELVEATL
jgi:hypothetical protein